MFRVPFKRHLSLQNALFLKRNIKFKTRERVSCLADKVLFDVIIISRNEVHINLFHYSWNWKKNWTCLAGKNGKNASLLFSVLSSFNENNFSLILSFSLSHYYFLPSFNSFLSFFSPFPYFRWWKKLLKQCFLRKI